MEEKLHEWPNLQTRLLFQPHLAFSYLSLRYKKDRENYGYDRLISNFIDWCMPKYSYPLCDYHVELCDYM